MTQNRQLQDQISAAIAGGAYLAAYAAVQDLWRNQPGPATAAFILGQIPRLRAHIPLTTQRVAILRSFTVEPVVSVFRAQAFANGIDVSVHVGAFNAFAQEILDPASELYAFDPEVVILAVQIRDIAPELWRWEDKACGPDVVARVLDEYRNLLQTLRSHHRANVIVHDFEQPVYPRQGLLDGQSPSGQAATIRDLNHGLRKLGEQIPGLSVLGYDELVAAHGRIRWFDERKWLTARLPVAADCLIHLGAEWCRMIACLAGRLSKVIVVDLDNTLWGGTVGEEGLDGLRLGKEYPGAAFRELQDALLACYERGILLAIASKNNAQDALEVLERHPEMLLRPQHFAAMRINWNDKAQSIKEIADELNVGIDSIAFLDDNPAERDLVHRELPCVTVLEPGADPLGYAAVVRRHAGFQRLTLLQEDQDRNRYYEQRKTSERLAAASASLDDFYRSLAQEVEVRPVAPNTVARVAQLTQKTNQFNLTTKRYTEQEIERLAAIPGWFVYSATVRDRFGDNGIVGVLIVSKTGHVLELDTLLLSCRVIGRTVETA
ncbi:MAG: HAD-IIIC family phosphatase, partial [Bryobacteraceae bacterium]